MLASRDCSWPSERSWSEIVWRLQSSVRHGRTRHPPPVAAASSRNKMLYSINVTVTGHPLQHSNRLRVRFHVNSRVWATRPCTHNISLESSLDPLRGEPLPPTGKDDSKLCLHVGDAIWPPFRLPPPRHAVARPPPPRHAAISANLDLSTQRSRPPPPRRRPPPTRPPL